MYVNSNTGFITGESTINFNTINAGNNWSPLPMNAFSISFKNGGFGFAAGEKIYKTINTGGNWSVVDSTYPIGYKSIYIKDSLEGWFTGTGGAIISTNNSGVSFHESTVGDKNNINDICFTDESTGYTCGKGGIILKTTNKGNNWVSQNTGISAGKTLYSISFINSNTGWVSSDSAIYKTINGGNLWVKKPFPIPVYYDYINKVFFRIPV